MVGHSRRHETLFSAHAYLASHEGAAQPLGSGIVHPTKGKDSGQIGKRKIAPPEANRNHCSEPAEEARLAREWV